MTITVRILPADHGDAIYLEIKDQGHVKFRVLIDGGPSSTYERQLGAIRTAGPVQALLTELEQRGHSLNLIILTHVDDDHIAGLLKAYSNTAFRAVLGSQIWFNSGRKIVQHFVPATISLPPEVMVEDFNSGLTSIQQGVTLESRLKEWGVRHWAPILAGQAHKFSQYDVILLSPSGEQLSNLAEKWQSEKPDSLTSYESDYSASLDELLMNDVFQEDQSIHNASSIAMLLASSTAKVLLLGDALPSTICTSLRDLGVSEKEPLEVDLCKISHHGSKFNTSPELLSLLRVKDYVISTNGSRHGLPHKTTIARILSSSPNSKIYFNYPSLISKIFNHKELTDVSSKCLPIVKEFEL